MCMCALSSCGYTITLEGIVLALDVDVLCCVFKLTRTFRLLMARISQIRVGSGGEYQYIYEDTRRAVTFPNPMTQRFQLDHG
jgi:hypothetical protein